MEKNDVNNDRTKNNHNLQVSISTVSTSEKQLRQVNFELSLRMKIKTCLYSNILIEYPNL